VDEFFPVEVIDVRWTPQGEAQLLVTGVNGKGGPQRWMQRGEVCQLNDDAVMEFFEWYNGDPAAANVCCVRDRSVSARGDADMNTAKESCAAAVGATSVQEIFVGLINNHHGCPKGYRPVRDAGGRVGDAGTCCDFFVPGDPESTGGMPSRRGQCGRRNCIVMQETAYCEPLPGRGGAGTVGSAYATSGDDSVWQAAQQGGGGGGAAERAGEMAELGGDEPEDLCALDEASEEVKAMVESSRWGACGQADAALRVTRAHGRVPRGSRCAWCRALDVQGRPAVRGGRCTPCAKVESLVQAGGHACSGFGPDFPCGSRPPEFRARVAGDQQRPGSRPEDNTWRGRSPYDSGPADTPFSKAPGFLRPTGIGSGGGRWWYSVNGPGSNVIAAGACPVTTLTVRTSTLGEPGRFQNPTSQKVATLEELNRDSARMQSVLGGLGDAVGSGIGDVETRMFPRMSASAGLVDASRTQFQDAAAWYFACSDSHATFPIMGTPGGDVGEFLLGLTTLMRSRPEGARALSEEEVTFLFQDYLETMTERDGKRLFFMCSDEATLRSWGEAAASSTPLRPRGSDEAARLADTGGLPQFVGSRHLQLLMTNDEEYESSYEVARHLVTAFLRVYYDATHPSRGRLILVDSADPPNGVDRYEAALMVDRDEGFPCGDMAPLIVPYAPNSERSFFVIHRAAVSRYREKLAQYFVERGPLGLGGSGPHGASPGGRDADVRAFLTAMERTGARQAELTLARLASLSGSKLPRFVATFTDPQHDDPAGSHYSALHSTRSGVPPLMPLHHVNGNASR
jgi:hypothetical protein